MSTPTSSTVNATSAARLHAKATPGQAQRLAGMALGAEVDPALGAKAFADELRRADGESGKHAREAEEPRHEESAQPAQADAAEQPAVQPHGVTPSQVLDAMKDAARHAGGEAGLAELKGQRHAVVESRGEPVGLERGAGRHDARKAASKGADHRLLPAEAVVAGSAREAAAPVAAPRGDETLAMRAQAGSGVLPTLGVDPAAMLASQPAAAAAAERSLPDPTPAAAELPMAQATLPMEPTHPAFAPALGTQIRLWLDGGVQQAQVELHPRDLGPIAVQISIEEGRAHIELGAEVASTRAALSEALPQLSAVLADAGLTLTGGHVSDQGREGLPTTPDEARSRRAAGDQAGAEATPDGTTPVASLPARSRGLVDLYA